MSFVSLLKSLPIDLGQGNLRGTTKGKRIALDLVPEGSGKTALDLGCREGMQTRWLADKGYSVTSVDREKLFEEARVMDADEDWPFEENSFDLIWCSEVIEHLKDSEHFKREVRRTLKPGGALILTTPNSTFWLYALAGLLGKSPRDLQNPTHLQFFSVRDVRHLFPEADLYGFFPYFILRCRIQRMLGPLSPTFVVHYTKPTE